jgi:hypothetical protein
LKQDQIAMFLSSVTPPALWKTSRRFVNGIPGWCETCSPSRRNRVHHPPGPLFGIIPESCSASSRNGVPHASDSQAASVAGTGERRARRVVSVLLEKQVLVSGGPRAPLRLAFPAIMAARRMPGLFPEESP